MTRSALLTAPRAIDDPTATAGALVERARAAQTHWRHRGLEDRIGVLQRAAKDMLRRRAEAVQLAREEIGKLEIEALFHEALGPLETVNGWAAVVRGATERRRVRLSRLSFPKKEAFVDRVPRGVVGVIAPWNFPIAGLYRATIPALMTGNAVLVKPSEHSARTSGWFVDRLAAHLPHGLVATLAGDRRAGTALINAGIDACVFTGSIAGGRDVAIRCAERGIPSSIEMGGKDAAIVLADCDLPRTIAGITHWALSNVGQACGAIEVAYVDETIADDFVTALRRAWTSLAVGTEISADVAPLANRRQLEVVVAHVDDARARGATVVCGGKALGDGLAFAPTILDHCRDGMKVVVEETFGPVLAIVRVDGAADAIRRTNASRYGLGASLWTRDVDRARRLAEQLDVGVVTINSHGFSGAIPALPWSGTRASGFGVANGTESLATFVRPKTTVVDGAQAPEPFFLPYDGALRELGEILADVQVGQLAQAWRIPLLLRGRVAKVRRFFSP